MKKYILISLTFLSSVVVYTQTVTITPDTHFVCEGDEVSYTVNIDWTNSPSDPIPPMCLTYQWNNNPISGQGNRTATFKWNSSGSRTLTVYVYSSGSGGGGGSIEQPYEPQPSPGESDNNNHYYEEDQCGYFDRTASVNVNVGDTGSGNVSASSSSYLLCDGDQATLTASTSGDATSGWLGWYNSSGTRISTSKTKNVSSPGTYEARATIGSPGCASTLKRTITIIGPRTYTEEQRGSIIGNRTVYQGKQVSGTIKLIDTSAPIKNWKIKRGSDAWVTYQNTSSKTISYTDTFEETTQIKALIQKDCPEQPNQYTPTITINVTEYIPDYHSITSTSYDNVGPIAKSAQYFDNSGKALQSQTWKPQENEVFASQPLYDNYDRTVGQTLSAPIGRDQIIGYKNNFATRGGNGLEEADWNVDSPHGVDNSVVNTLGYYYSSNNSEDGGLVPETSHPYVVSNFYEDGSGEQMTSSQPGDYHFLKSGNNSIQKVFPVFDGELRHYGEIRNLLIGQGSIPDRLVKRVVIDANGNEVIIYTDESGSMIASAISGGPLYEDPISKPNTGSWIEVHIPKGQERTFSSYEVVDLVTGNSASGDIGQGFYKMKKSSGDLTYKPTYTEFTYNFYDAKGRMVASMTPMGTQKIIDQGGLGTIEDASDLPYTTLYMYDFQGRLTSTMEPDAGETKYKYRKDGQIRFSQNEEQYVGKNDVFNRFSFTDYDNLGRPIRSAEYKPFVTRAGTVYQFDTIDPDSKLEITSADGNILDWIKTYYDIETLPSLPAEFSGDFALKQEFVAGAVSSTESEEVKSWFSYDEQGRVTWFLQYYEDLEKYFLIEYEYDFLGNVTKVAFQPQTYGLSVSEAFWHHYTYDKNQRLLTVETSVHPNDEKYLHASYEYYKHGPLKRVVLAQDMQGIDYTYTPQGWLKAINHPVRDLDPGADGISNSMPKDFFGMSLEYFEGDYARADKDIGSLDLDDTQVPQQYNGNIRAMVFGEGEGSSYSSTYKQAKFYNYEQTLTYNNTLSADLNGKAEESITLKPGFNSNGKNVTLQVTPDVPASHRIVTMDEGEIYAYEYDEKYQLKKADYTKNGTATNSYDVSVDGYDENGNIEGVERYGDDPNSLRDDFAFHYDDEIDPVIVGTALDDADNIASNHLLKVDNYIDRIYYNEIGQVTGIEYTDPEKADIEIYYNVTGKVTDVWDVSDPASPQLLVEFEYDDRGFRAMKRVGDVEQWYVRDASGQVMAIYNKESQAAPIAQIELPIYGASKLGMAFKNPDHYKYIYELTDHLGNVRALATKLGLMATASMETENDSYEQQYFDNISNRSPNKYRSGNESVVTNGSAQLGPASTFRVKAGDVVNMEVFATYDDAETYNQMPLSEALKNTLGAGANDAVVGVEGGQLSAGVTEVIDDLWSMVNGTANEPKAYLQFVLLDENYNRIATPGNNYRPVTGAFDSNEANFEKLELSLTVPEDGFIYVYIVNESDKNIHWDDFTISVVGPRMIRSTDYYPFGAVAKVWNSPEQLQQETYRHDYQGQYAEKDEETGWNVFEARMYDPLIGRWLAVDPSRQFASGYVGMGNNPIIGIDPDGRYSKAGAWLRALFTKGVSTSDIFKVDGEWGFNKITVNSLEDYSITSHFGGDGVGYGYGNPGEGVIKPYEPNFFGSLYNQLSNSPSHVEFTGKLLYGMLDDAYLTVQPGTNRQHLDGSFAWPKEIESAGISTLMMVNPMTRASSVGVQSKTLNAGQFNTLFKGTGLNAGKAGVLKSYNHVARQYHNAMEAVFPVFNGTSLYNAASQTGN